jgi:8-oxo-dGTP pyrophosphatase MutT (NUDIX family)
VQRLVETRADCFERSCWAGHVTASAWVLSPDGRRFLLTHHRKLGRWLQLGGHADGDPDPAAAALREAREESGLVDLRFAFAADAPVPIDLDVHAIPARGAEPAHDHHDVRFVLVAAPGQTIAASDESNALEWFEMDELETVADDDSVLRLGLKVRRLLEAGALRLLA